MQVKFDEKGLVPAIVQDAYSGEVLMMAYMNKEAYDLTLKTGKAHFYSRSRQKLWLKGETSGHYQHVKSVALDCDGDCVLVRVKQDVAACHTGAYSCFFNEVQTVEDVAGAEALYADRRTILERIEKPVEGSYTNYLWTKGIDKICKKIAEEAGEVIIASQHHDSEELKCEFADLLFHMQVLMAKHDLDWSDVFGVLKKRAAKERVREWKA